MPLLTFPLIDPSVGPQVGASRAIRTATSIVRTQSGLERRRVLRTIPGEELEAFWGPVRDDSRWIAEQVAAFFRQVGGPALPFVAFDFDYSFQHQRIYVATGDGTTDEYNLPCRDTASAIVVFADGVEVTSGLTLSDDGANERKKATFTTAPAAGVVLTASFVGQRAWVCRFADDELVLSQEDAGYYGLTVRLIEVRGEA